MEKRLKQLQPIGGSEIIKIAFVGPESTGKSTIAKQLAEHYKTAFVPEFARDYLQEKWNTSSQTCELNDILPIAYGQIELENKKLQQATNFLFCDTNLMLTKIYSELHFNYCHPSLHKAALKHDYDLIFLTDIDFAWEKDDLRANFETRQAEFEIYKKTLTENNKPFLVLSGNKDERFNKSISVLEDFIQAKKIGFSSKDFVQIQNHDISIINIKKQLKHYRFGVPKSILVKPAIVSNGIFKFSETEIEQKLIFFDGQKSNLKILKFVPASGAASRMFQFLNVFLNEFNIENESINAYINRKKDSNLSLFIVGLEKFPFYEEINKKLLEIYPNFSQLDSDYKQYYFIKTLLSPHYFDFSNKPKAVLPFHKYKTHIATPIEEHLNKCFNYVDANNQAHVHFTISEAHQQLFESEVEKVKPVLEAETKININISYSYQNKKTDILSVSNTNRPIRNKEDKLIFRPGGHGALLENLNQLDADIIFIKNIDNVIQTHKEISTKYKKALAGILLETQNIIFNYLRIIEQEQTINISEILDFISQKLYITISEDVLKYTEENQIAYIKKVLNRPIRVCGMVKNEGDTGGGPFWVQDSKGGISLQIVETAQIDLTNANQSKIFAKATHFNPVDIVCGIFDFKKNKFNLTEFVDYETGFIVQKNKDGILLKSYELPGLWNGAMAKWISIFVEVPLITFNPVKTVNDLLKAPHQPQ